MAKLDATTFVSTFLIGTVLKPEDLQDPKLLKAVVDLWTVILGHIESTLQINAKPPITVSFPPALPIATGPTLTGKLSGQGTGLKNTGAVLVPKLPQNGMPPQAIANLIKNYDLLFDALCKSATISIVAPEFRGEVATPNGPVPLSGVSITPMIGEMK